MPAVSGGVGYGETLVQPLVRVSSSAGRQDLVENYTCGWSRDSDCRNQRNAAEHCQHLLFYTHESVSYWFLIIRFPLISWFCVHGVRERAELRAEPQVRQSRKGHAAATSFSRRNGMRQRDFRASCDRQV
jgi:hypothetical protein